MRNTQGAQHGLSEDETAGDKTDVSFGESDKLQRQTVEFSKMPDKLIIASVLLPQETKHSGTADAEKGSEVSEETAEKPRLSFILHKVRENLTHLECGR